MLRMRTLALLVTLIVVIALTVPSSVASPAATSPVLGAAETFSVLAALSAASANMTTISGDLGLSPGLAVSRTGPWTVGGTEYFGPLSLAANAQTDALAAFINLAGQTSNGVWSASPWSPLPGVWTTASDTTFAGTITLNGGYNDVWIFQVGRDMTFSGAVVMSGNAQPCHVFWQIGRDATIASGSTFVGTIIASRDISLVSGATVDGRVISLNSSLTTDNNTITGPTCVQAAQSITTHIHNAAHAEVFSATVGTIVHDMAIVTGTTSITPTGTVSFTVFANQTCAGAGTFAGVVPLVAGVADPSNTATLTNAGLSYLAHYNGDGNYVAADGPCEVLGVLAAPTITTQIHDINHAEVTNTTIPTGTIVHDMALVTGTLGIPTGIVTFTVYANSICSATGTFAGAIPLVAGVADPSYTATLTSLGLSYLAHYSGDANYAPADGVCEVLNASPTAVELLYFQADPLVDQQVQLKWATALEVDNFGFNLYRANENDLTHANLIHFEPAVTQGSGSGATYGYIDTTPTAGVWWYWLSDVDTKGRETFHVNPINLTVPSSTLLYHVYLPFLAKGSGN